MFPSKTSADHSSVVRYGSVLCDAECVLSHRIDKVTPQTQQGPLSRLKQFLEVQFHTLRHIK